MLHSLVASQIVRNRVDGRLSSIVIALGLVIGCAHAPPAQTPTSQTTETKPESKPSVTMTAEKPPDATAQEDAAHKNLADTLQNTKLFFNFDDFTLNDEGKQALTKMGDILAKNPRLAIRVEGNCDERGTEDYNLALGQKRADAAKTYLLALGVKDPQVITVSYGSERPAAPGHDEPAWKQNRRDDVLVTDTSKQAQAQ